MKKRALLFILFCLSLFNNQSIFAQSDADTIDYFIAKHPQYKSIQIERTDLLAVAALYRSIDEKDTAWAEIAIRVQNKRIVDLSITGLNKTTLPEPLLRLDALEGLAIKGCYLYGLPSIKAFPLLKNLSIWTSRMKDTLVVDESYRNLEILGLHHLHAKSIKFAENLKIKTLFVIDCDIAVLHKSFVNLKQVEEIHLGGNKLTDFDLSMLPKLKKVNCYKNPIPVIHRKALKLRHKTVDINFDVY